MKVISNKKSILLILLFVILLGYLGNKYLTYLEFKTGLKDYVEKKEQEILLTRIDLFHSKYGVFPFTDDASFDSFLTNFGKESNSKTDFAFEKMDYGVLVDSLNNTYTLYLKGPDGELNDFELLPFNKGEDYWDFQINEIDFLDFLLLKSEYDVILNRRKLDSYDCAKKQGEIFSVEVKKTYENSNDAIFADMEDFIGNINKDLRSSFNSDKQSESISARNPIFRFQDNRFNTLCDGGLTGSDLDVIESVLNQKLNIELLSKINLAVFPISYPASHQNTLELD